MVVKAKVVLLNTEIVENKKDSNKPYMNVGVMQGTETRTLSCRDREVFEKIKECKQFTEITLLLDYISTPKFTFLSIKDLEVGSNQSVKGA